MINPPDNPARLILSADWRVLAFGLALAFGVTILFGLAPALRASSVKPVTALKGGEDPHSRRRLMYALMALAGGVLFRGAFRRRLVCRNVRSAVESAQRLFLRNGFSISKPSRVRPAAASLSGIKWLEHLREMPGVEKVALDYLAAAERRKRRGLYFDQRRAAIGCLFRLPEYLPRLDRHHEDSLHRRPRFSCRRDISRALRSSMKRSRSNFSTARIQLENRSTRGGAKARGFTYRDCRLGARCPLAGLACAGRSCRRRTSRSPPWMPRAHSGRKAAGHFIVRTSGVKPTRAGVQPAAGSIARAVRIPRQQCPYTNGNQPSHHSPRTAAGYAGAVLRDSRAGAGGRRSVWRAGLLGDPTAPRNRHSYGARRASRRHRVARNGGSVLHGAGGSGVWAWRSEWPRRDIWRRLLYQVKAQLERACWRFRR